MTAPAGSRLATRLEIGDQAAGYSFRPSAIREPCHRNRVVAIAPSNSRMRYAWRRRLPTNRTGRWPSRMTKAMATPTRTPSANRSTSSANQPCSPSHGIVQVRFTDPSHDMTIVGSRTRKPQNRSRCMIPGMGRRNSLDWPRTPLTSRRRRAGMSSNRADRRPCRTRRHRYQARRTNRPTKTSSTTTNTIPAMTVAPSMGYAPRTRRISALIAGSTWCRSPITA